MQNYRKDLIAIFVLFVFCVLFYVRLFLPRLSLFFTPDLGRSDIIHLEFSSLNLLNQELAKGRLSLWTDRIGTGVSLIGKGNILSLNIIFVLLFSVLSPVFALNLIYLLHSMIASVGTYILARYLGFSRFVAVFTAMTFTFAGCFLFQITHPFVFASIAFLPLIILFALRIQKSQRLIDALLLALVISQQISTAHPQIVFVSLVGLVLITISPLVTEKNGLLKVYRTIPLFLLAVLLGFGLAAVHLVPMLGFKEFSTRQHGLSFSEATFNSLTPKFFLTLIYPFIFGNPVKGTYQLYSDDWDIFWEKMGYIGLVPLLLALVGIVVQEQKPISDRKTFIFLLVSATLLAFGRYSPTFFFYFFPPFNFFRVPARFLALIDLGLSILAGYGLMHILQKWRSKIDEVSLFAFKIGLLLVVFIPAFLIYRSYHPVVPAEKILKKPDSATFLQGKTGRTYHIGTGWPYLQMVLNFGWEDISYYLYALNSLDANIGILYDFKQVNLYDPLPTQRQELMQSLLRNEATADLASFIATSSAMHKKLLNLVSARFLISPFKFADKDLQLVKTIPAPRRGWRPYYIYENKNVLPRVRVVDDFKIVKGTDEAAKYMQLEEFNPAKTVILENAPIKQLMQLGQKDISVVKVEPENILIDVNLDKEGILALADSYSPGWQAFVDKAETVIYPANMNQRAIFVPAGKHRVEFRYTPKSVRIGAVISSISVIVWVAMMILGGVPKRLIL